MMWRDMVELITIQKVDDGAGGYTETETSRQVFANKKSIRQSEFYQAHMAGLNPELMFEIRSIEYQGEEKILYNGDAYRVIRTYSSSDEITELVCERW